MCLFQGGGRGNIFLAKHEPRVQQASLRLQRTYVTLVAFVCDDLEVQRALPQVLVVSERAVTIAQLVAIRAACPPTMVVVRQKSAWNTAALTARIVHRLRIALEPFIAQRQPLLIMDTARIHLAPLALRALSRANIWTVLVPPSMTFLLQPLDTDIFALLKAAIQNEYQNARVASGVASPSVVTLATCVATGIQNVLCAREWGRAFARNGYGDQQRTLGDRVKTALQYAQAPILLGALPSDDQLRVCLPRRSRVTPEMRRLLLTPTVRPPAAGHCALRIAARRLPGRRCVLPGAGGD